jgi:hypothetical protein
MVPNFISRVRVPTNGGAQVTFDDQQQKHKKIFCFGFEGSQVR